MDRNTAQLVTAVLEMANDLAWDPDELNATLKANKPVIDQLSHAAPDIWQRLKAHTQNRRTTLQREQMEKASPLTSRGIPRT